MLMTAGLGTRLRPFTHQVPKPVLPVMGIPMAQYAVDMLDQVGVQRIICNVHHQADLASAALKNLDRSEMTRLEISDESSVLLGSAGGIRKAMPLLGKNPFYLVNGDMLCDIDLKRLWHHHQKLRFQWGVSLTLAVFPPLGPFGRGSYTEILLDQQSDLIRGLGKKSSNRPFFSGIAVIEPEAVENIPEGQPLDFVQSILEPAIENGRAGCFLTEGLWMDIGSPELWLNSHLRLIQLLETGRLPTVWRRRIENANTRVASGIWCSRRRFRMRPEVSNWAAPCYWSGTSAPKNLGPKAVLYGAGPVEREMSLGIGYGGEWVSADPGEL